MGFGAILSAVSPVVGSLAGALINKRSNDKQHQYQTHVEQRNTAMQYDFAKNALQWRAEDARKAGIHPLAAMGASTHSPSSHVSGGGGMADVGSNLSQMGQDIGRAIRASTDKYTREVQQINLENLRTDSAMKKLQYQQALKSANQQTPPPVPNPTQEQTNVSGHVDKIKSRVESSIGSGDVQAGQNPMWRWQKAGKNSYTLTLSEAAKQSMEDSPQEWIQQYRMFMHGDKYSKPFKAPKGKIWEYSRADQTVRLVDKNKHLLKKMKRKAAWGTFKKLLRGK